MSTLRHLLLAGIALLALTTASVSAQAAGPTATNKSTYEWSRVAGWTINVDNSMNGGCFAHQRYERGTIMRIGFDMVNRKVYFLFGRDSVSGIEDGKKYRLKFIFDGGAQVYTVTARVFNMDGVSFLYHGDVGAEFMADFANRNGLRIVDPDDGTQLFHVSLANTQRALDEVVNCQKAQQRSSSYDPQKLGPSAPAATPAPQAAAPAVVGNDTSWTASFMNNGTAMHIEGRLNDEVKVDFVLDTGASGISITRAQAKAINARVVGQQRVVYADGRKGMVDVVIIPRLQVGQVTVTGLEATISENDAPALLGKNFLDSFASYEIDNKRGLLVMRK